MAAIKNSIAAKEKQIIGGFLGTRTSVFGMSCIAPTIPVIMKNERITQIPLNINRSLKLC
ncbi:MAG: hypothetical protein V7682_00645 [Cycloclasticus sp.]